MPLITVDNVGSAGVIKDIFNQETPPEAWTAALNARMGPYGAERILGHMMALGTSTGWTDQPLWLFYVPVAGAAGYWVSGAIASLRSRLASSPYTERAITRAVGGAYSASAPVRWNGCMFGSLLIANDGADVPQSWVPGGATNATDLANWPATYRCGVMGAFGRFLVALDITKAAVRYPQLVKWSHPADPGAVPASWDPADATKDAGEFPLQDAEGVLVDQLMLRDANLLYTTDQVWQMRYVQGGDVMGFSPLFHEQGALATHCVTSFKKQTEFHAVLGGDDVYIHNGQTPQSILTPLMRRWLFQNIDANNYKTSFVVKNPIFSEIWVCYPENGASMPTMAMIWNWETGTIGFRELLKASSQPDARNSAATQGTPCIVQGLIEDLSTETWASDLQTWQQDTTIWNARTSSPATPRLLMVDRSTGNRTYLMDTGASFDGTPFTWTLERSGLSIIGRDRQGNPKNDQTNMKLLTEIWPRFDLPVGTAILVEVGLQARPEDPVNWTTAGTFTVGQDLFVPTYYQSRYVGVRFSVTGTAPGRLLGYALNLTQTGLF